MTRQGSVQGAPPRQGSTAGILSGLAIVDIGTTRLSLMSWPVKLHFTSSTASSERLGSSKRLQTPLYVLSTIPDLPGRLSRTHTLARTAFRNAFPREGHSARGRERGTRTAQLAGWLAGWLLTPNGGAQLRRAGFGLRRRWLGSRWSRAWSGMALDMVKTWTGWISRGTWTSRCMDTRVDT